jgi:hypothetical protein
MSIEREGFVRKDPLVRMEEIKTLLKQYIPQVDLSEGEILFQLVKIAAMREDEMQNTIQQLVDNLSLGTAYGECLRALASNVGAYPSFGSRATGNLLVTTTVDLASMTIPTFTVFATTEGAQVMTSEQATALYSIPVTRGAGLTDTIPVTYQISDIEWIYSDSSGIATEYTGYTFADGEITWDGNPATNPPASAVYFVRPVDGEITVVVPAMAAYIGPDGHVAPDIDLTCSDDPGLSAVVGPDGITGGTDIEADDVLKARAQSAKFRNRTVDALKTLIENVDGVDEVAIQEVQGTDVTIPDDWPDDVPAGTIMSLTSLFDIKQKFSPGEGVASIRSVDLWMSKPTQDYVGGVDVYIYDANEDELDHHTVTNDDFDYAKGTDLQLINVPLKAAPLYSTEDFYIGVSQSAIAWGVGIAVSATESLDQLYIGGVKYENTDLAFRTKYLANYYNVQVAPMEGYVYSDVADSIETLLDDEESGFSIYGVDHVISQITSNYIRVDATIYTKRNYLWTTIATAISDAVGSYIDSLGIGDPVIYNGIVGAMMGVAGVANVTTVVIYKDSVECSNSTNENSIVIAKDAKAVQDTPVVNLTHGNP